MVPIFSYLKEYFMKTSWWVRFSTLIVFCVLSFAILLPTLMKFDENSSYPIKSKINLGLDLQGGLYMVLGIDFKKVYKDEVSTNLRKVESVLKDQEITITHGDFGSEEHTSELQSQR